MNKNYKWYQLFESSISDTFMAQGTLKKILVGGREICLTKNASGYAAVSNRCPHAGGLMSEGWLNENDAIVCPLHRYTFDPQNGRPADNSGFHIICYPIKEIEGFYCLGIVEPS